MERLRRTRKMRKGKGREFGGAVGKVNKLQVEVR